MEDKQIQTIRASVKEEISCQMDSLRKEMVSQYQPYRSIIEDVFNRMGELLQDKQDDVTGSTDAPAGHEGTNRLQGDAPIYSKAMADNGKGIRVKVQSQPKAENVSRTVKAKVEKPD